ncbi:MAG TPA: trehalose-phosphatase [Solirubrobacteraceae bacterium]|nr:trehalose-phosphatase [Solirubrobacteraceae bacterium]
MSTAATLVEALTPLRADPTHAAILLDIDGTLAPIVRQADDAIVAEATRSRLIAVARRYAVVACVSGRTASDARRLVAIGSIGYIGNHGGELLRPGTIGAEVDPELVRWERRVQEFAAQALDHDARRLRVRLEDKGPIVAFHWRGAPDEDAAESAVLEIAQRAEQRGLHVHWGRKVLEVRPPVEIHKGVAVGRLLRELDVNTALYAGDDLTDLDAFRAIAELAEEGRLDFALRVGVRSDEGPPEITAEADIVVDGVPGVDELLDLLLTEH